MTGTVARPSRRDPAMAGSLEVWLTGTPAEVDTVQTMLARTGRVAWRSPLRRLAGTDTGRVRLYLRITLPTPNTLAPGRRTAGCGADLFSPPSTVEGDLPCPCP